jgi:diguanylate cyclase (GGDEF)-like protein
MSVGHGLRVTKHKRDVATRTGPSTWALWTVPRSFLWYVLVVDAAAVVAIVVTATAVPVTGRQLGWFALLVALSALHLEANRRIERLRELAAEGVAFTNLTSIWTFAGLLLLPPPLVAALIVIVYAHMWVRVSGRIVPHRWVFTAATVVLASAAGGAILAAVDAGYPGLPPGWAGLGVVVAAAVARWLVNTALVVGAMLLMSPDMTLRTAIGTPAGELVEWASLSLGAAVAALLVLDAPYLLVLAVPVIAVHRGLLLHQFKDAARKDGKTGLLNATFWRELAGKQLERAHRLRSTVGLLLVDVDGFRVTNDHHGPLVGDRVLRRVGEALTYAVRQDDLVGRLGGEEFAVLLPDTGVADLTGLAERVREAVRRLHIELDAKGDGAPTTINGLTVSVGGAVYPDHAGTLEDLLMAADNALFVAKSSGRDQARVVAPGARPSLAR